jgi:hypothetical protein
MQACTARNHDAAFLAATIGSVEGIQCETLADPFFAPAVSTREAVERELARCRVVRVHKVQARHEEAIRRGLIERTALACLGIDTEIARILELKIGATGLTLEELFRDHAVYFGFCSLSGHRLREEESAFVTDPRRNPAFKQANGEYFTEELTDARLHARWFHWFYNIFSVSPGYGLLLPLRQTSASALRSLQRIQRACVLLRSQRGWGFRGTGRAQRRLFASPFLAMPEQGQPLWARLAVADAAAGQHIGPVNPFGFWRTCTTHPTKYCQSSELF